MTPTPPVIVIRPHREEDPLRAFRGIMFGTALGGIIWTIIVVTVWLFW